MPRYAELVYNGFWFSPERRALQAAIDETQNFCTGTVRLKLYKVRTSGTCFPLFFNFTFRVEGCVLNVKPCHLATRGFSMPIRGAH